MAGILSKKLKSFPLLSKTQQSVAKEQANYREVNAGGFKANGSANIKRGVRAMIGGEHSEE